MANYRTWLFSVTSFLSLVVAAYHVVGIFYPIDPSPAGRHFIFVCICLFCSYGLIKRPPYFIYFFFVLVVQQYYSHGNHLLNQWNDFHRIDWIDLLLLIFLSIIFVQLIHVHKKTES